MRLQSNVIEELFSSFKSWRDKKGHPLSDGELADFLLNTVVKEQRDKTPEYELAAIVVMDQHGTMRFVNNEQFKEHLGQVHNGTTVWSWYEIKLDGETYKVDGESQDF